MPNDAIRILVAGDSRYRGWTTRLVCAMISIRLESETLNDLEDCSQCELGETPRPFVCDFHAGFDKAIVRMTSRFAEVWDEGYLVGAAGNAQSNPYRNREDTASGFVQPTLPGL